MYGEVSVVRRPYLTETAVVADAGTISEVVNAKGLRPAHVVIPDGFDGTALQPQGSFDGTTFRDVYDSAGALVDMTVAADRIYALPAELEGLHYVRFVVSPQSGACTLTVGLA